MNRFKVMGWDDILVLLSRIFMPIWFAFYFSASLHSELIVADWVVINYITIMGVVIGSLWLLKSFKIYEDMDTEFPDDSSISELKHYYVTRCPNLIFVASMVIIVLSFLDARSLYHALTWTFIGAVFLLTSVGHQVTIEENSGFYQGLDLN